MAIFRSFICIKLRKKYCGVFLAVYTALHSVFLFFEPSRAPNESRAN